MPNECLNGSEMPKVLKALDIANKRIDELEKYNLDLANESHNKSLAIERANKRVKELEQELKESDDDLCVTQQQSSNYESALEEIQNVFVDSDACPFFEPFNPKNLSAWLNKFATKKKIEGYVKGFIRGYKQCEDDTESGNWTDDEESLIEYARDFSEQLRKEQE